MLVQFAQLGVAYAQLTLGVATPRVGLLTIGAEPGKGDNFTRRAHELLASDPPHGALPLSFAGNVEGGDLLAGELDVIVTDEITGNVALKTLEGSIRFASAELRAALTGTPAARLGAFLQRRALRELAARLDAESYGGAVLLGLGGTVVIAHGASTARAVTSACLLAADLARGEITEKITQRLSPGRSQNRGHFLRRPLRSAPLRPAPLRPAPLRPAPLRPAAASGQVAITDKLEVWPRNPQQVLAERVHDAIVVSFSPEYGDADPLIRPSTSLTSRPTWRYRSASGSAVRRARWPGNWLPTST